MGGWAFKLGHPEPYPTTQKKENQNGTCFISIFYFRLRVSFLLVRGGGQEVCETIDATLRPDASPITEYMNI